MKELLLRTTVSLFTAGLVFETEIGVGVGVDDDDGTDLVGFADLLIGFVVAAVDGDEGGVGTDLEGFAEFDTDTDGETVFLFDAGGALPATALAAIFGWGEAVFFKLGLGMTFGFFFVFFST